MNVKTFVKINRQEQARKWLPMPRRFPRHTATIRLVPRKELTLSDRSLRTLAHRKAKEEDYLGAISLFTQLIDRDPNSAVDYNNRGLMHFRSGQREKALIDYNKALQINPQLDSVYNNRANYYASAGELAKALNDYEEALDLNPANSRTWINQAITFRELGLHELALENLDLALMLGYLEDHIHAERGRTYHLRGDWNCAISDYQKALKKLSHSGSSGRLRRKVETWMSQLLEPLSA